MFHSVGARGRTYASPQKEWESAVAMSPPGTKLPIRNVRSPVANRGKADNICLFLSITGFDPTSDIGRARFSREGSAASYVQ